MREERLKGAAGGLSDAELREAQRGFTLMLRRKRFSPEWIEEHVGDLIGQAAAEYARKLATGRPADNPVGWIINCAWRRNQNLLTAEGRRPRPASLETTFHLADEHAPTPEEVVIARDRRERVVAALGELPNKERKLIALVYYEKRTIREAGRIIGWGKSAADRHHAAAIDLLQTLLGDDRSLLSPATLGLAAWASTQGDGDSPLLAPLLGPARRALATGSELAQRLLPFSDTAGAAASSGAGRALGYCATGMLVAVCGLGASGVIGPGVVGAGSPHRPTPAPPPPTTRAAAPAEVEAAGIGAVSEPTEAPMPAHSSPSRTAKVESGEPAASPIRRRPGEAEEAATAPAATPQQTQEEFGIENTSPSSPPPAEAHAREAAPAPAAPRAPSGASRSTGSSSGGSSSGSAASNEFGL